MRDIIINHITRAGSTCIKEIEIGNKNVYTLQTFPKMHTSSDLKLFFGNQEDVPDFQGVVLDFWTLPELRYSLFPGEGQRRLEDNKIAITPAKMRMDEKVLIIDPSTEEFHSPYTIRSDKDKNIKITRLDKILGIKGCPQQVIRVLNETKGDAAWRRLSDEKLILSYIDWYVRYCTKFDSDVILPPSPLINGKSQSMLDLSLAVNLTTQKIIQANTQSYPSVYIPISSDAFKDEQAPKRIMDLIYDMARPNLLINLKFYQNNQTLEDVVARHRMRDFLMVIDALKKEHHDSFAVMVHNTKSEGVAFFGNGVDLTCDPLGGVKDRVSRGKKKKEDTGDDDEYQSEEYKGYGKYFHNELREYLSIPELKSFVKPSDCPIHPCAFCKALENVLLYEKDDPQFPKLEQWNTGRRLHNFICRRDEDEHIRELVASGDSRAVEKFLKVKNRGNKNLIDLLPT